MTADFDSRRSGEWRRRAERLRADANSNDVSARMCFPEIAVYFMRLVLGVKVLSEKPVPVLGAPTKRTSQARERVLRAIRAGTSYEAAAGCAGISYATLTDWRKRDEGFESEIIAARAELEYDCLATIERAASDPRFWTAAAWLLERAIDGSRYGAKRPSIEVTGPNNGPIAIDGSIDVKLDGLTTDELRKLAGEGR